MDCWKTLSTNNLLPHRQHHTELSSTSPLSVPRNRLFSLYVSVLLGISVAEDYKTTNSVLTATLLLLLPSFLFLCCCFLWYYGEGYNRCVLLFFAPSCFPRKFAPFLFSSSSSCLFPSVTRRFSTLLSTSRPYSPGFIFDHCCGCVLLLYPWLFIPLKNLSGIPPLTPPCFLLCVLKRSHLALLLGWVYPARWKGAGAWRGRLQASSSTSPLVETPVGRTRP